VVRRPPCPPAGFLSVGRAFAALRISWKARREERRAVLAAGLAAAATAAAAGAKVLVRPAAGRRVSASGGRWRGRIKSPGPSAGRGRGGSWGLLAPALGQGVPLAEVLLQESWVCAAT
jgi:hypothetical protein